MYIILFDGVCNFCNASINFIIDRDSRNKFRFASLQSDTGRKLLQHYQVPEASSLDSVVLIKNDKIYKKSAAALEIVKELNGLWPILYIFKILPTFILNTFYNVIAKNRYRIFGRTETCRIPTPQLKQKFL